MKQTIGLNEFRNAFKAHGRKNFTYDGLAVLFDALEDAEHGREEEMELDVIGLCCDFVEMTADEVKDNYTASEDWQSIEEFLIEHTFLCGSFMDGKDKRFVFQQF
jgi:hypothetical protein